MAINPLGGVGTAGISGAGSINKPADAFSKVLKGQAHGPSQPQRIENSPIPAQQQTQARALEKAAPCKAEAVSTTKVGASGESKQVAGKMLDQVQAAQSRMDHILQLAESGKAFSPAELLSLQAHVYRASQELDLAGKVVEKATNGVKQVLQTQV
ncbi:MAG: ATP-dependent helicase HrpB [Myxococcales bacterium]|nr:ATP-dependent helicase HrpB [Myxococcales bacterium]